LRVCPEGWKQLLRPREAIQSTELCIFCISDTHSNNCPNESSNWIGYISIDTTSNYIILDLACSYYVILSLIHQHFGSVWSAYDAMPQTIKKCQTLGQFFESLYLIKWKGYNSSENSWIPESELTNAEEELNAYKKCCNLQ
jgi:hypothetical protein